MDSQPRLVSHEITFRVRYAETDQMGFAHHANYLVYFEMGRIELLRASGMDYGAIEAQGLFLVVAQVQVRYRAPARYDDQLSLTTSVKRVTPVRIEHQYQLRRDTQLLAEGESTLACVDRTGKLQSIPEELLASSSSSTSS